MAFEQAKPFICGGIASVTAELVSFPFDLTKTRLQLQGQVIEASLSQIKYKGMIHAFVTIAKEEGLLALYNGISPAVLRQATYGTLKMGFYNWFKKAIIKNREETLGYNVICGMFAGGCAGFIASPTDLLKGAVPTIQRGAIVTGVELGVYDCTKRFILRKEIGKDNILTHFWASVVAGLAGTIATNPIDVVRTRLMNQKKLLKPIEGQSQVLYKSSLHCIKKTVATEGFMALYKGFFPLWLRLAPWNTTFFIVYEKMKTIL